MPPIVMVGVDAHAVFVIDSQESRRGIRPAAGIVIFDAVLLAKQRGMRIGVMHDLAVGKHGEVARRLGEPGELERRIAVGCSAAIRCERRGVAGGAEGVGD